MKLVRVLASLLVAAIALPAVAETDLSRLEERIQSGFREAYDKGQETALFGTTGMIRALENAVTGAGTAGSDSVAGSTVTVSEAGAGVVHQTTITLTSAVFALTDEAGVVAYSGVKLYDMPAGQIVFLGAVADLAVTKSSAGVNADWDGDVGLGTTTAGNNNALATTEQNLIPTTATPQAVAGVTTADCKSTSTEIAPAVIDGTTTAMDVYLNFLVDDADHDVTGTAANLLVTGTVKITWINTGDN